MKVGIIGTGAVGSSAAFAMVMSGVASELVLIDPDEGLASAQADDLEDATPFAHAVRISADDYHQLAGARVVVLCCGARRREGESRLELLARNAEIFRHVIANVVANAPEAILIVVSNPVDILTDLVCRISGLPTGRVFGTGTVLDTARFRARLGTLVSVSPRSIHGYVLGEHGESEVLVWSSVAVGGIPLDQFVARPLRTRDINMQHVVALAESIAAVGLIHPPAVDRMNRLRAGAHRLAALRWLQEHASNRFLELFPAGVPVWRMDLNADSDVDLALAVEISENERRRDYRPAEIVKLADRLKAAGFHYAAEGGRPRTDDLDTFRIGVLSHRRLQSRR